jgi:hypothetical protein
LFPLPPIPRDHHFLPLSPINHATPALEPIVPQVILYLGIQPDPQGLVISRCFVPQVIFFRLCGLFCVSDFVDLQVDFRNWEKRK